MFDEQGLNSHWYSQRACGTQTRDPPSATGTAVEPDSTVVQYSMIVRSFLLSVGTCMTDSSTSSGQSLYQSFILVAPYADVVY